jgi:hypothetical protein
VCGKPRKNKKTFVNSLNASQHLTPILRACSYLFPLTSLLATEATHAAALAATKTPASIPWNQIGAKAGEDYQGDGLAVTPVESGVLLHCIFQRLDGEVTPEGLWLTSTVTNSINDRFSVKAMAIGRTVANATFDLPSLESSMVLAGAGAVSVRGQTVRFSHPGLKEEYSVSLDGLRQDFILEQALLSAPPGELVVQLAVSGAQVEAVSDGVLLVLDNSGRKIAYNRLRVTDATGKELPARIEISSMGDELESLCDWGTVENNNQELCLFTPAPKEAALAVVVNDADAVYPVRIDPTFSDANWVSMGGIPGAGGEVNAAVSDGSGNLYIGGEFAAVGKTIASNIARWNGTSWSALGSGISGAGLQGLPFVSALAVSGSNVYVGGNFTTAGGDTNANYMAEWDGTNWSALGSGMNNVVAALAVSGSTLYAGGQFTTAGSGPANYIAQWNGTNWYTLGSGMNNNVSALAVLGSTLYAGGAFTTAGGSTASYIAQWKGNGWSPLGLGMNNNVSALAVSGGALYAAGGFTTAGGLAANSVAQWNGTNWSILGSAMNGSVYALAVSGGTLYASGEFSTAGSIAANSIAQWDGTNWSALGSGIPVGFVFALAVLDGTVYAGGDFTSAGGIAANNIAQWNGSDWSAPGSGLSDIVDALAVSGSTVYAGGIFTSADGIPANSIAKWNGSSWSALGSGLNGPVYALAVSGSNVYAGGYFTTAGGNPANSVAQWNGTNWSALGSGFNNYVYALAASGGTLYAGGMFASYDGSPADYIAQWNGTNWSAVGSGINSYVYALAVSGGTLYAGGQFGTVGGGVANSVAQWNGSSWSPLGSGMTSYVSALAAADGTLYAGGDFTFADGNPANYIAQWNGSGWSALGSGMNSDVQSLAVLGTTLYAGGEFTSAGSDTNVSYIAEWNGTSWSSLGSGVSGGPSGTYVEAMAMSGSNLFVGGNFTIAGTNVSSYAAEARLAGAPVFPTFITTNATFDLANGLFGFNVAGPAGSDVVIQASTNLLTWIPLQTNLLGSGLLHFTDPQSQANRWRFYRAQLLP